MPFSLFQHRAVYKVVSLMAFCSLILVVLISPAYADTTPTLQFSTYLGGVNPENAADIKVDAQGYIYVVGNTHSDNFPITANAAQAARAGDSDVYILKMNPQGTSIIYSTYLGGSNYDKAFGMALDVDGSVYVTGYTSSNNFPTTANAVQPTYGGATDAFVTKLSPDGSQFVYSTYLGGNGSDTGLSIGVDSAKHAHITGYTTSTNLPVQQAYQASLNGTSDIMLASLNASGSGFDYLTYLGGNKGEAAMDTLVDASGNSYLAGWTSSSDFPVIAPLQAAYSTPGCSATSTRLCNDGFVVRLNSSGTPTYATYLGGDGLDEVYGIALGPDANIYLAGATTSTNFPILNAYQGTRPGTGAAFVSKLNAAGSSLIYSTYLGGSTGSNQGVDIAVNSQGYAVVSGITYATNFPVLNAIQATKGGSGTFTNDAFITMLSPNGGTLEFSTYLGGTEDEYNEFNPHLALNAAGDAIHIVGTTMSTDFPVHDALQDTPGGASSPFVYPNFDGYVAKIAVEIAPPPDPTATPTLTPTVSADSTGTLQFSTYLGGNSTDFGEAIAVDGNGNIYVTGSTASTNFPATNALGANAPGAYVTKFDPTGTTILYSVFIGGGTGYDIAVDADGNAYVVGEGINMLTASAIQPTPAGGQEAFISKINPSGTALIYATYLGGSSGDVALGVALDSSQNVYVVGATQSTNFPTQSAYQNTNGGGSWDAFLVRLKADGSDFDYATYLGGNDRDMAFGVAVDNNGNAYVTGEAASLNFPTVAPQQPQHDPGCAHAFGGPCTDAFVAKFNASGAPVYSTYLGGNGALDRGYRIAVDGAGSAYVTGYTDSTNFPVTANVFQPTPLNVSSGFVTKFSPNGSTLAYSTYLSGAGSDTLASGIAVDGDGQAYIAGVTASVDFPTVNPIQATKAGNNNGSSDAFIVQLSADASELLFSTYFGGSDEEYIEFSPKLALDSAHNVYITGSTYSQDFPVFHAYQPEMAENLPVAMPRVDSFVAKIALGSGPPPDPTATPTLTPTVSAPGAATTRNYFTTDTPTLTWTAIGGAMKYHVQASKNSGFTGTPAFEGEVSGNTLSITTDPLDDGLYYWRVQALRAEGEGGWSPVESFTIDSD